MEYPALLFFVLKNSENAGDIAKKSLHAVPLRVSLEERPITYIFIKSY